MATTAVVAAILACWSPGARGQYEEGTLKFKEFMETNTKTLDEELRRHEELRGIFDQEDPLNTNLTIESYVFSEPRSIDFEIGLIVDPCRQEMESTRNPEGRITGGWDCCMDTFGTPEYGQDRNFVEPDSGRRIDKLPLANLVETQININPVRADMGPVLALNSRRADDETFIAEECEGLKDPFVYCRDFRLGERRFRLYPKCMDNNESVYADVSCIDPAGNDGELMPSCTQVGFTQTAFSVICKDRESAGTGISKDPKCGTYLEVHIPSGTEYDAEEFIVGEAQVLRRDTDGYLTMTLPLSYGGRPDKILCNYKEEYIRIGSLVYINSRTAPRCCCPHAYTAALYTGFFFCPGNELENFDVDGFKAGPFASSVDLMDEFLLEDEMIDTYPYCPVTAPDEDVMYCSDLTDGYDSFSSSTRRQGAAGSSISLKEHQRGNRNFVYKCPSVKLNEETGRYGSDMLRGTYEDTCPYFDSCAATRGNAMCNQSQAIPELSDFDYSFRGFVGKVTALPDPTDARALYRVKYWVTFNNGRTSYPFDEEDLSLEYLPHNYEMWWVQRTSHSKIVKKRKPFKVQSPTCTFDKTNDRYFPWAYVLEHTKNCTWCKGKSAPCTADTWPLDEADFEDCLIVDPAVNTPNPTVTPLP